FRHSGARQAWVTVVKDNGQITSTVRDDGKGLSERVAGFQPESLGIGIAGMRQRVKEFSGELRLSNTGSGALLEAVIPIKSGPTRLDSDANTESVIRGAVGQVH